MNANAQTTEGKKGIITIANGVIISLLASLCLILLFALLIKWLKWSDAVIAPVNIAIKIISLAVGIFYATRSGKNGIKTGVTIGVFYIVISYIIFSILLGSFAVSIKFLWDFLLGIISGAILGVIFVNLGRN